MDIGLSTRGIEAKAIVLWDKTTLLSRKCPDAQCAFFSCFRVKSLALHWHVNKNRCNPAWAQWIRGHRCGHRSSEIIHSTSRTTTTVRSGESTSISCWLQYNQCSHHPSASSFLNTEWRFTPEASCRSAGNFEYYYISKAWTAFAHQSDHGGQLFFTFLPSKY